MPSVSGPKRRRTASTLPKIKGALRRALFSAPVAGERIRQGRGRCWQTLGARPARTWTRRRAAPTAGSPRAPTPPTRACCSRRACSRRKGRERPHGQPAREDLARAGLPRGHRVSPRPGSCPTSSSSASTSRPTAAPPASATPARSTQPIDEAVVKNDHRRAVLSGNRNFEARIHPTSAPTSSRARRRWWSRSRSPGSC